jgi:hypothetical protein
MATPRTPNTIKLADGRRVVCKIYDSGEEQFDRYTIVFRAKRHRGVLYWPYLGASERPFHSQGLGQYGEASDRFEGPQLGKRITFEQCPPGVQKFILQHFN